MLHRRLWLIFVICATTSPQLEISAAPLASRDGVCSKIRIYRITDNIGALLHHETCTGKNDCSYRKDDEALKTCCIGWMRDQHAKEFRCVKIDPSQPLGARDGDAEVEVKADQSAMIRRRRTSLNQAANGPAGEKPPETSQSSNRVSSTLTSTSKDSAGTEQKNTGAPADGSKVTDDTHSGTTVKTLEMVKSSADNVPPSKNHNSGSPDVGTSLNSNGYRDSVTTAKSSDSGPTTAAPGVPINGLNDHVTTKASTVPTSGAPIERPATSPSDRKRGVSLSSGSTHTEKEGTVPPNTGASTSDSDTSHINPTTTRTVKSSTATVKQDGSSSGDVDRSGTTRVTTESLHVAGGSVMTTTHPTTSHEAVPAKSHTDKNIESTKDAIPAIPPTRSPEKTEKNSADSTTVAPLTLTKDDDIRHGEREEPVPINPVNLPPTTATTSIQATSPPVDHKNTPAPSTTMVTNGNIAVGTTISASDTATHPSTTTVKGHDSASEGKGMHPTSNSSEVRKHPNDVSGAGRTSKLPAYETGSSETSTSATISVGARKNCSNATVTKTIVQNHNETLPSAVKSSEVKLHYSGAETSIGSASKTTSEVTISLLLVGAIGFVAALMYWRSRRRRQQYLNYTMHESIHFSNPVYEMETELEQSSLVKLQDAAHAAEDYTDNPEAETPSCPKPPTP